MSTRPTISRRRFLAQSATTAALAAPYFVPARVLGQPGKPGPNDRIEIGVIGVGIRGKYQIANVPPQGRVVAVCDWYTPRMDFVLEAETASPYAALLADFRAADAKTCGKFQDYRHLIDQAHAGKAKLDALMITSCDHHHVHAATLACQAGLDVYVEKPLSVTIREGRALVAAAKKHGCVIQVGSQQRSMEMNQFACKLVRDSGLGKISSVTLVNYPGPEVYKGLPEEKLPATSNWDLFCGPTPLRPYNVKLWAKEELGGERFAWRGWDMWRDYSGHLMTNHAAHSADMAQLALGMDHTGPVEIEPLTKDYKGPMNRCPVVMRYANGVELRFEARSDRAHGETYRGDLYRGERGTLTMRRNAFAVDPPGLVTGAPDRSVLAKWTGGGQHVARPHIANWLDCLRTRGVPNAPVEAGHRTATICHLAGIARELRRKLRWDPDREQFVGDEEADRLLERPRRKGWELPPA
jgi:predicted dehydrogenase